MPTINVSSTAADIATPQPVQPDIVPSVDPSTSIPVTPPATPAIKGLSPAEYNDPNKIIVTVPDTSTPVVVLYGPPACGKTMTMVRLVRYLRSQGLVVKPEKTFRPSDDKNYENLCADFDQMITSADAAGGTPNISFMLVRVFRNGKPLCQILEAPGEHYFNPANPGSAYPAYVNAIISSPNRKVWAVIVEPDWADPAPRSNYVQRIAKLKREMNSRDKVLFVYNKIDLTPFVRGAGQVNYKQAVKNVKDLYPGIFEPFANENLVTRWLAPYRCEFVPFQTGTYTKQMNGGFTFTQGHDAYPASLWKAINDLIH